MKKFKLKKKDNWKASLGLFIKSVICPVLSAVLTWLLIESTNWQLGIKITVGLIAWFFWFRPVTAWLLSPIWNSLYIPTPDLPTDSGIATCILYSVPDLNILLVRGISGELLEYDPVNLEDTIKPATRLPIDIEDKLEAKGEVRLKYSFQGHVLKTYRLTSHFYYRNTPGVNYKWPKYSYVVLDENL